MKLRFGVWSLRRANGGTPTLAVEKRPRLKSSPCSQAQLESSAFQRWCEQLGEKRGHMHRKIWEWCYIAEALHERDMLRPGTRGLGFAVGHEPLVSLFASVGCSILATDLDESQPEASDWIKTDQHASDSAQLNDRGICAAETFARNVTFRAVDMNAIPRDLTGFDFCWSACSFEHLGSIEAGKRFVHRMVDTLRPGGVGVHTTEFNLSSNDKTIEQPTLSLFRRRDIEAIAASLRRQGHAIELDFTLGHQPADLFVDRVPFKFEPSHLKLQLGPYVATSFGLIVTKAARAD